MKSKFEPGLVQVLWDAQRTFVMLSGEITGDVALALREAVRIANFRSRPLEVHAAHVTNLDSSAFAAVTKLLLGTRQSVSVISPSEPVNFLLHISGIAEQVTVSIESDGQRELLG